MNFGGEGWRVLSVEIPSASLKTSWDRHQIMVVVAAVYHSGLPLVISLCLALSKPFESM